jgi:biotin transporter BioY
MLMGFAIGFVAAFVLSALVMAWLFYKAEEMPPEVEGRWEDWDQDMYDQEGLPRP